MHRKSRIVPAPLGRYGMILEGLMRPVFMDCRDSGAGVKRSELASMAEGRLAGLNRELSMRLMERRALLLGKGGGGPADKGSGRGREGKGREQDDEGREPSRGKDGKVIEGDDEGREPMRDDEGRERGRGNDGKRPARDYAGKDPAGDYAGKEPEKDCDGRKPAREDESVEPGRDREGKALQKGEASLLDVKCELGRHILSSCRLCGRRCGVDRTRGEMGFCGVGGADEIRVSSMFLHMGEEPELVPSLTVFFSGCTLECAFCQNWDISRHPESGVVISPEGMARRVERFLDDRPRPLNVNWVGGDPTPAIPYILETLNELRYPVSQAFNSNMYLSQEAMELLEGVVDLYLADFKFGNDDCASRLCGVKDYTAAVARNHRKAAEGADLIVRHLLLPGHLECCTLEVIRRLEEEMGHDRVRLNLMDQYRPEHRAREHPDIDGFVHTQDIKKAIGYAERVGFLHPY